MLTDDELRALADALEPLASLERSGSQGALALESTIAYLRAQADAQPVAWIAHNLTTGHVKWTTDRCRAHGWIQGGNLRVKPLYAHPAPAAPQAEPKPTPASGDDLNVYREMADGYRNDAQAEPKREPLTYEQLVSVCYTYRHDFGSLDPDEQELVIEEAGRWAKAFGIEGSDAE